MEPVKDETWKPKLSSHAVECECEGCKRSIRQTQPPDYGRIALAIAKLVQEKQAAYGDSFGQSGKVLEILYPLGVQPKDYTNFLTVVRVIDKLFRIATDKDAFGESPWGDILGYSLLVLGKSDVKM